MVLLFFVHDFSQINLGNIVIFPEIFMQFFLSPMSERTTVMLVLFGRRSSDDISAIFGPFGLFLTNKSISVVDVIHMALEIRVRNLRHEVLPKILFVVLGVHAASLEEEPQLTTPLVLEMVKLLQFLVEVHHARREELSP
jgi:hypothetical protein